MEMLLMSECERGERQSRRMPLFRGAGNIVGIRLWAIISQCHCFAVTRWIRAAYSSVSG